MKKILIVDDNQNNRILLRALIEEYCEDNSEAVIVHEAINGAEASLMAEDIHYNIIFMDIMMPEMDGIEATGKIRTFDSKVIIVAISAVDDGERQRQILSNGAEDYISKPINAEIFLSRLGNYFSLIQSRENIKHRFNPSAANVISTDIFSRKLLFYIQNEDDLAEFWEYYLLTQEDGSESLSGGVRTLYALGTVSIKLGIKCQIIVEESDLQLYMTMTEIDQIDSKIIKLIFIKNLDVSDYKIHQNKLSIRISRPQKNKAMVAVPLQIITPATQTTPSPTVTPYVAVQEVLQVYDYMEPDDLNDLEEYIGKLNSLMMVVGSDIEHHEIDEISNNLQHISRISSGYTDSYKIGQALSKMGISIGSHSESFMAKSNDLAPMCAAFGRDLSSWIRLIFIEGASSVHYMDDTIIANAQMIESILTMDESGGDGSEGLDDIFDF
ncbi:MAG: response regulator [Sulfuricurvum sp.]|nr:response regulator [Sulfuricurvum sp.]MDD5386958.1 response regulator [Sulfuricurvum sp.]